MVLFIFGSTGDLARRKIVPALRSLNIKELEIIALGRKDLDDKTYERFICGEGCFDELHSRPKYQKVEFSDSVVCEHCAGLLRKDEVNFFYSALPPRQVEPLIHYVGALKRGGYSVKVLIEKPFGNGLQNAERLQALADSYGLLPHISVSDHYLFKDGIRDLKADDFKDITMVSLESIGLEKRAGYYDEMGALKDMVQSHFLNIIFRILPDARSEFEELVIEEYVRAQYGNGKDIGYVAELGRSSATETFTKLVMRSRTKLFRFITGKAFDSKVGFVEFNGRRIEFDANTEDYSKLFLDFFAGKTANFASVSDSILGWKILEALEKYKPDLRYYGVGSSSERLLKNDYLPA